jgi:hypothetical protein
VTVAHPPRLIADSSASPVAFTISNWNQNDEVFKEDILGGSYPMPIKGANRLDLRDVAEASAKARWRTGESPEVVRCPGWASHAYPERWSAVISRLA